MPIVEFHTFDTFAYYQDCNPLLWFVMIKNVDRKQLYSNKYPFKKHTDRNLLLAEDNEDANIWPSYLAEKRIQFLGSTTRDAGINVTDVICAPSLQLINLANSFIEGYESKLEKKDKVLEIKIDGGFSESIQYYYVHEKLKANFIKCGYPIDRAHETSYKCPENCNNESPMKMNERVTETLKSIRAKYSDSTGRTMVVFMDKCLEPAIRFLIKQPLIALELYVVKKLYEEDERKKIEK
ncbi:hypothetical protein T4A_8594 [Trichinella pseudospiralis]|uniref:Uncharacterized protein n=4 Tax=Trichinella pseudospiralis TaxID=6337 RepID=A0A0V1DXE1_TRIPS|nr:hypothetical protein T4A_8594 [Trichinella pseudospiralis]